MDFGGGCHAGFKVMWLVFPGRIGQDDGIEVVARERRIAFAEFKGARQPYRTLLGNAPCADILGQLQDFTLAPRNKFALLILCKLCNVSGSRNRHCVRIDRRKVAHVIEERILDLVGFIFGAFRPSMWGFSPQIPSNRIPSHANAGCDISLRHASVSEFFDFFFSRRNREAQRFRLVKAEPHISVDNAADSLQQLHDRLGVFDLLRLVHGPPSVIRSGPSVLYRLLKPPLAGERNVSTSTLGCGRISGTTAIVALPIQATFTAVHHQGLPPQLVCPCSSLRSPVPWCRLQGPGLRRALAERGDELLRDVWECLPRCGGSSRPQTKGHFAA